MYLTYESKQYNQRHWQQGAGDFTEPSASHQVRKQSMFGVGEVRADPVDKQRVSAGS